jgi:SAM-dependent methyltransferase
VSTAPALGSELMASWARLMRCQVELAFPVEVPFFIACDDWRSARRVVDLGCGTGEYLASLGAQFPDKQYTGVECDARYVARAEALFRDRPSGPHAVTLVQGDAFEVSGEFDAVVARLLAQHLEQPERLFEIAGRLLSASGTLIVIESVDAERCFVPAIPEVEEIFAVFRKARRQAGRDRDAGLLLTRSAERHAFALHQQRTVVAPSTLGDRRRLFVETYGNVFSILQADFGIDWDFARANRALERWHQTPGSYAHIGVHLACYRRATSGGAHGR